jgi:hypothetical protein
MRQPAITKMAATQSRESKLTQSIGRTIVARRLSAAHRDDRLIRRMARGARLALSWMQVVREVDLEEAQRDQGETRGERRQLA